MKKCDACVATEVKSSFLLFVLFCVKAERLHENCGTKDAKHLQLLVHKVRQHVNANCNVHIVDLIKFLPQGAFVKAEFGHRSCIESH